MSLRLPAIDEEGLRTYQADRTALIHNEPELFTAFKIMIENTRNSEISDTEASMLREAMRRDKVTAYELNQAFWSAYKDHYTPSSGIEWRHLWKHIQAIRDSSYTRPELPSQTTN